MWIKALFAGEVFNVWQCPEDIIGSVWKVGELGQGQVWAQLSEDGPYRAVTPLKREVA